MRGDNLVPIEFEISIELPDRYIRKDEIPAQESGPTASALHGPGLLAHAAPLFAQGLPRDGRLIVTVVDQTRAVPFVSSCDPVSSVLSATFYSKNVSMLSRSWTIGAGGSDAMKRRP